MNFLRTTLVAAERCAVNSTYECFATSYGNIAIGRQSQFVIAVAPMLDKCDVWMREGGCGTHDASLP